MRFRRNALATGVLGVLAFVAISVAPPSVLGTTQPHSSAPAPLELGSGVLVVDSGPRYVTPGWPAGLWHVTPAGVTTKLVGRRWRVDAWHPNSGAVARRRDQRDQTFGDFGMLQDGDFTRLPLDAQNLSCPSWSSDGKLLAYITGASEIYTAFRRPGGNPAVGLAGKLWVAHTSSLERPVQVTEGLFPECPAWSPTERSLAYLIRGDTDRSWEMRIHEGHRTDVLQEFRRRAPSVFGPGMNRTFDFSSNGDLFFLARRSIYMASNGEVTRFGPAGVLNEIRDRDLEGWLRFVRVLRVSPDGDLVAATVDDDSTGIVGPAGVVREVENRLRAWSGNFGVMTFGLTDDRPAATLYPVDPDIPPRPIENALKVAIHADLEGNWSAHNVGRGRPRVVWRNPDGSVLSVTQFDFNATNMASIAGGVVDRAVVP